MISEQLPEEFRIQYINVLNIMIDENDFIKYKTICAERFEGHLHTKLDCM